MNPGGTVPADTDVKLSLARVAGNQEVQSIDVSGANGEFGGALTAPGEGNYIVKGKARSPTRSDIIECDFEAAVQAVLSSQAPVLEFESPTDGQIIAADNFVTVPIHVILRLPAECGNADLSPLPLDLILDRAPLTTILMQRRGDGCWQAAITNLYLAS
jgi:hypothetical protein